MHLILVLVFSCQCSLFGNPVLLDSSIYLGLIHRWLQIVLTIKNVTSYLEQVFDPVGFIMLAAGYK